VLEDNARTPSGVSYVIENRHLMMRAFPDLAEGLRIADVDDYGRQLAKALSAVAPSGVASPNVVLMSPGVYNSAYFEHVFLAREMGAALVEGRDLIVEDARVYMRTTRGREPVHVIYRRIDDDFLDPLAFRPDSMLGVPGLFEAYLKGNVTLANAVGTGVADDKAVYAYMPRIIKYYLDEDPILANVPTHICREPEGLQQTLDHLDELVTKPVGAAGGYGVVVGPRAGKRALALLRAKLQANPANFISQPMINLSVCPTLVGRAVEPRHVDLRPFAVTGDSPFRQQYFLARPLYGAGRERCPHSRYSRNLCAWQCRRPRLAAGARAVCRHRQILREVRRGERRQCAELLYHRPG
jgi:uncharacterized circularly permuted ATP-grasp superfamily protein